MEEVKNRPRGEMKIWFDTEFIEDGKTIELISIGMVREDGAELYLESSECDKSHASQWVVENVFPHLTGDTCTRAEIAKKVLAFAGEAPQFWAYYADYDWVVLCQLFGTMMQLPSHFPMFCRDLKQLFETIAIKKRGKLPMNGQHHNALSDARWCRDAFLSVTT
jgi:hypothetical protein